MRRRHFSQSTFAVAAKLLFQGYFLQTAAKVLDGRFTTALADYLIQAKGDDPGDHLPRDRSSQAQLAEAEAAVDEVTAQIRALTAVSAGDLALKIRALSWDAGFAHRLAGPENHDDFEMGAMRALVAVAVDLIAVARL